VNQLRPAYGGVDLNLGQVESTKAQVEPSSQIIGRDESPWTLTKVVSSQPKLKSNQVGMNQGGMNLAEKGQSFLRTYLEC